ncbi:hypothetical protein DKX38_022641 [Salix brachista]|uniref:Transcription factor TFIIB cyclin-like domain-containing protein n=1 Tax=Salix brachista TaxID=2182728 RepID=A0A5N5K0P6_9ROSI|nr:hypothetical protein DKX38_022641 [Salix brachista]
MPRTKKINRSRFVLTDPEGAESLDRRCHSKTRDSPRNPKKLQAEPKSKKPRVAVLTAHQHPNREVLNTDYFTNRESSDTMSNYNTLLRSPISIAAAVIYIITHLSDDKKPLKDISVVTQVAEGTIKNAYKDLSPHLSQIIPSWFAKEEDIKNLHS